MPLNSAAPKRGVFASFALLLISMMLSGQAQAFDSGDLSYTTDGVPAGQVAVTGCRVNQCVGTLEIVIPNTVMDGAEEYSVTSIGQGAFALKALTSVDLPDSVTTIEEDAFTDNKLSSVIIPDSVTTIGEDAFSGNGLTSLTIGNSVAYIGYFAFSSNSLTSVVIPDSITRIESRAFRNNNLTSVAFEGNYLSTLNDLMFLDNDNLATITYYCEKIGWPKTFYNGSVVVTATATKNCQFPVDGLSYTITGEKIVEVTGCESGICPSFAIAIPDTVSDGETTYSVTRIGRFAFRYGPFTSVIIPDSVTSIGDEAFLDNALTSVTIGNSVTTIGNSAFSDNALTRVIIPGSVTTIGQRSFDENKLTSVNIPDSVTTIQDLAFERNRLISVAFDGDFGIVGYRVFSGNPNLATITYCDGKNGWPRVFDVQYLTTPFAVYVATNPIDCRVPPDAPVIQSVESGDGELTVRFSVQSDGGASIQSYTVTCGSQSATGNTSPITVSSLSNDVQYSCSVVATNAVGTSPASSPSTGKPEEWIQTGLPIWLLYEASKPAQP